MKDKIDALLAHKKLEKLTQLLGNTAIFVGLYAILAAMTYILPYYEFADQLAVGLNSLAEGQGNIKELPTGGGTIAFILHLIVLSLLVVITYIKAAQIKKTWFVILPVLAFAFDILPLISLIPLVPTGLHIATLIIAAKGEDKVVYAQAPAKEEPKED